MSELKTIYAEDTFDEDYMEYHHSDKRYYREVYLKSEADKVIAEKDAEITDLKKQLHDLCAQSMDVSGKTIDKVSELMAENDRLKKEISDITDGFCDSTHTHIKELRATRRALWLARAKRARAEKWTSCGETFFEKWLKVQHLCMTKAKEYK